MNSKYLMLGFAVLFLATNAFAAYIPTYVGSDLGNIFVDLFGLVVANLAENAPTLVTLLIVGLIAVFGRRALDAIFGVFNSFR